MQKKSARELIKELKDSQQQLGGALDVDFLKKALAEHLLWAATVAYPGQVAACLPECNCKEMLEAYHDDLTQLANEISK